MGHNYCILQTSQRVNIVLQKVTSKLAWWQQKAKKNLWTSLIMNNYYCVNNSLSFGARLLQLLEVQSSLFKQTVLCLNSCFLCFVHASQSNIFTRLAFFLDLPWLNYLVVVYKVILFCYWYSSKISLKCHDLQRDLSSNFLCHTTFAVLVRQLHSRCL